MGIKTIFSKTAIPRLSSPLALAIGEATLVVGGAIAAISGVLLAAGHFLNNPPLMPRFKEAKGEFIVETLFLGEYPKNVSRMEIHDLQGSLLWRVSAKERFFQIHGVSLHQGFNQVLPNVAEEAAVVEYPKATTFVLDAGKPYEFTICAPVWGCTSQRFTL